MSAGPVRHAWVLVLVLGTAPFVLDERTMSGDPARPHAVADR